MTTIRASRQNVGNTLASIERHAGADADWVVTVREGLAFALVLRVLLVTQIP